MTARWVVDEVAAKRDLRITWQPISLLFKNEMTEADEPYPRYLKTHKMLRVMESVRAAVGDAPVGDLYWEYGRRVHHDQDKDFDVADALTAVGLDAVHAAAFEDEAWDAPIRERMAVGIELAGEDIGTPIIGFHDRNGDRRAFFGPVITRVPSPGDSLDMWDSLMTLMNIDGFWELKRTRTERPDFGDRP